MACQPAASANRRLLTRSLSPADVVDAAGDGKRCEQRASGILAIQRGAQAGIRMILAGTRSVEQPQAQHHAAPPGGGEPADLLLGGKRGAQDDRDFSERRVLRDWPVAWVDEGDGRLNIRLDVGGQSGVDQDGRGLGAQPVVVLPGFGCCIRSSG